MDDEIVRSDNPIFRPSEDRHADSADGPVPFAVPPIAPDMPEAQRLLSDSLAMWAAETDLFGDRPGAVAAIFDAAGKKIAVEGAYMFVGAADLLRALETAAAEMASASAAAGDAPQPAPPRHLAQWHLAVLPGGRMPGGTHAVFAVALPDAAPREGELLARAAACHYRNCLLRLVDRHALLHLLEEKIRTVKKADRRDLLFESTKRLHDQIEVTSVLGEILNRVEALYPGAETDMFLTQDYADVDPRVKPLVLRYDTDGLCARAFLEGQAKLDEEAAGKLAVAVPLTGKQAIYGVLRLTLEKKQWEEGDLADIAAFAETAGTAFENAKLYEQSNLLIQELRLINELTKRLNRSLRLKEIYKFTTDELLRVFDAEFSCLLHYQKEEAHFVVASCNVPAMEDEKFSAEYGFCGMVYRSKEPLIVSEYTAGSSVPSKLMQQTNAKSLIAAPILVDGEVAAVILVAHRNANYFSYDNYKLLQVLCTHIGLAVTNASLHAEVRRMVITDNLTGLHARHYLDEQIGQRQRKDPCGSLVLVDIDYFKQVNDTYGHQTGDRILKQVSDVIRACIRETDIAARWGGEELAVYLPMIRTEQAYRIAERIRIRVQAETDPAVTVSCGVSEWLAEDDKISVESLFYRADMALYEAKHNGRNRVYIG